MDRVDLPKLWELSWRDVDPASRPAFDPTGVAELVRMLPTAAEIPPADADWRLIDFWYARTTSALIERLGRWVACLQYTVTVEDYEDRGLVPIWRVGRFTVTTPSETLTDVADAVVAWHELLVELATDAEGRFAVITPAQTNTTDEAPAWQAVQGFGRVIVFPEHHGYSLTHPSKLTWPDADPTGRIFDRDTVPGTVSELVASHDLPEKGADWRLVDLWLDRVTTGLTDRYGLWTVGWRWSVGEGDLDGGPVSSWCCFRHSATTREATTSAISAAVVEWHDWLEDLTERFDRFLPLPAGDLDGWELAVAHLVTAVGDRTHYESGWYGCCRTVLGWFLAAAGIPAVRRKELLDHAIGGRFHSWVEPTRTAVESVAERLAGAQAARDRA